MNTSTNSNSIDKQIVARQHALHRLGHTVPDYMTGQDALQEANLLGWDVRKLDLRSTELSPEGVTEVTMPERKMLVRTNPNNQQVEPLDIVGKDYHIFHAEELVEFLDTLVDESSAHYNFAGSSHGGRCVFVGMELPQHLTIGGVDAVDLNLVARTWHGTGALTVAATPIRLACSNMLDVALGRGTTGKFRVTHRVGMNTRLQVAREALQIGWSYAEEFEVMAEAMIQTTVTEGQFMDIIRREFGPKDGAAPAGVTRAENMLDDLNALYFSEKNEGIVGTAWGAWQAFTEYADHYSPVKAQGRNESVVRAEKVAAGGMDSFKARALDLFREPVLV